MSVPYPLVIFFIFIGVILCYAYIEIGLLIISPYQVIKSEYDMAVRCQKQGQVYRGAVVISDDGSIDCGGGE